MKDVQIIALAGKMGSGKDFLIEKYIIPYIEKGCNRRCLQLSFADQLKVNVMTINNVSYNDVYIEKTNITRSLLQKEGTENGRDKYGKDIWIRYLDNWIKIFANRSIDVIIINDLRFLNEYNWLRERNGTIIKIDSPNRNYQRLFKESKGDLDLLENVRNHISECELDNLIDNDFDFVIKNDNLDLDKMNDTLLNLKQKIM